MLDFQARLGAEAAEKGRALRRQRQAPTGFGPG